MPLHPPKGYLGQEFPLYHDIEYKFGLSAEGLTKDTTIIPIMTQDASAQVLATTYVNPKNTNFEVSNSPQVSPESIVPYMSMSLRASLTKLAIETDLVRSLSFNYMLITTAFLSRLDAVDSKTGFDVESILELTHETTDEQAGPLWSTVDIGTGNTAANTYGIGGTPLESVAFDKEQFFDAMHYFDNRSMLRVVAPSMRTVTIKRDFPYVMSGTRATKPICKFQNPYSFAGLLVHVPQTGDIDQYGLIGDTTAIDHVNFTMKIRYPEWNKGFYQESI